MEATRKVLPSHWLRKEESHHKGGRIWVSMSGKSRRSPGHDLRALCESSSNGNKGSVSMEERLERSASVSWKRPG